MKKIVIQTSAYFTKDSWEKSLVIFQKEELKKYKFIYVVTNNELLEQITDAYACFCFSAGKQIQQANSTLEIVYLGISDIDYADEAPIYKLYTSKGQASKLIAEYALLAALYMARKFDKVVKSHTKRIWDQATLLSEPAKSISDYKIGVLGLGSNGKEIVDIFHKLGSKVLGLDITEKLGMNLDRFYKPEELDDFLNASEILIVALPLRESTRHFLQKKQMEMIGAKGFLINTSRGDIIKENDLMEVLKNGTLKAAVIDVTSMEPLPKKSKLWKIPNLLVSPHIAGNINYFVTQIQKNFIEKISQS